MKRASTYFRLIIVVISLMILIAIASFQNSSFSFRRNIATLRDSSANKIELSYPTSTSISNINKIKKEVKESTPRIDEEFMVYKINCNVRGYKNDQNGDYILDLVEDNDTIKAKIINADIQLDKLHLKEYIIVRQDFEKCILPDYKVKNGYYKIIGIGFFGKNKKLEISPILYFQKFK